MHCHVLATGPGVLHHCGQGHVANLFDDVHLAQRVFLFGWQQMFKPLAVSQTHVLHMTQPVVGQANADAAQCRAHTGAAVVAHHHDVLDLQVLDGKLDGGQSVQVGVHNQVGDVAMYKHFTRVQARDFIRGHAAVSTTNPHVLGALLLRQAAEKPGLACLGGHGPGLVVGQQFGEFFAHVGSVGKAGPLPSTLPSTPGR